ncbi:hypothetical protein [Raoultibacter phocaeensis]|uniref:hypothetical protein n=1 Tax=Raoultibacter phocaeensis TaxID=2479841 RepID=UPI00111AA8FD|nr:hypothetical protein [Raoultibacter phocaeensis]
MSVFDGMLWSNTDDLATYLAKSDDPAAVTKEVLRLDDHVRAARHQIDTLYRGCGSVPYDEAAHTPLLDDGLLVCKEECSHCGEMSSVRLSEKGRMRFAQVFDRLAHALI